MKKIYILLLAFCLGNNIHAQSRFNFAIAYPVSFPTGDLNDYIGEVSFRGILMEFNHLQTPNINVGLETGWLIFYEKVGNKVYTDKTASISGTTFRYTNTVPILLGAKYSKTLSNPNLKPYIGVGLGTLYIDRYTRFGLYRIVNDTWQFCIRPELGLQYRIKPGL